MNPNKTKLIRNSASFIVGATIGLYIGQFCPDLYFVKVRPYLPAVGAGDGGKTN